MQHVFQEDSKGCGIACVAMVSGLSYQAAKQKLISPKRDYLKFGLDDLLMPQFLLSCGRAAVITYPYNPLTGTNRPDWPSIPLGALHILCVQTPRGAHYVVLGKDGMVRDPDRAGLQELNDYPTVHYYITCYLADN